MQMTDEVRAALDVLKKAAENDFERLAIERMETALTNPPRVEVIDETHQRFNGLMYYKDKKRGYYYECTGVHQAVWRYYCGDIPFDFNIHHVNGNKDDNQIENLQMKSRADHAREHGRHTPKQKFICVVCGKEFEATNKGTNQTCSDSCRTKKNRKTTTHPKELRICVMCGKEFYTDKYSDHKACSPHCGSLLARQSRREGVTHQKYEEPTEVRQCVICGKTFTARKRSKTRFCSQACVGIYRSNAWKEAQTKCNEETE